jgi:hypothetical protein
MVLRLRELIFVNAQNPYPQPTGTGMDVCSLAQNILIANAFVPGCKIRVKYTIKRASKPRNAAA